MTNERKPIGLTVPYRKLFPKEYTAESLLNPKREWVGLTNDEVKEVERWVEFKEEGSGRIPTGKLVLYIEAKLKEKNT